MEMVNLKNVQRSRRRNIGSGSYMCDIAPGYGKDDGQLIHGLQSHHRAVFADSRFRFVRRRTGKADGSSYYSSRRDEEERDIHIYTSTHWGREQSINCSGR